MNDVDKFILEIQKQIEILKKEIKGKEILLYNLMEQLRFIKDENSKIISFLLLYDILNYI